MHYVRVSTADAQGYVTGDAVTFTVPDPRGELAALRLVQDVRIPGDQLGFRSSGDHWVLVIPRPPVTRMEYLIEFSGRGGGTWTGLDPGNPCTVDGAFGPKSVLEFPGYAAPEWLAEPGEPGTSVAVDVPASPVDAIISCRVWAPADAADGATSVSGVS